jgi:hypothetical protein
MDTNIFYTYMYLREDRTPYYIGKGSNNRAYVPHNHIPVPKDKSRIVILKKNLTEERAFTHEIYMISVLGRKDLGTGMLINLTSGGEGKFGQDNPFYGKVHSQETKRKWSETRKGKYCGLDNPFYGRKHTEESRRKMSEGLSGPNHPRSKTYILTDPQGVEHTVTGRLIPFCKENNLNVSCFTRALKLNQTTLRRNGWMIRSPKD